MSQHKCYLSHLKTLILIRGKNTTWGWQIKKLTFSEIDFFWNWNWNWKFNLHFKNLILYSKWDNCFMLKNFTFNLILTVLKMQLHSFANWTELNCNKISPGTMRQTWSNNMWRPSAKLNRAGRRIFFFELYLFILWNHKPLKSKSKAGVLLKRGRKSAELRGMLLRWWHST